MAVVIRNKQAWFHVDDDETDDNDTNNKKKKLDTEDDEGEGREKETLGRYNDNESEDF